MAHPSNFVESQQHDSELDMNVQTTVLDDGATSTANSPTFAALGVHPAIVEALAEKGIEHTFAIQELTLPLAMAGQDLIGQARTGMGKTYGFGVPLLHRLVMSPDRPLDGTPRALVVVPTRELCLQVEEDLAQAAHTLQVQERTEDGDETGRVRPLSVLAVYGGTPYEPQIKALHEGVDLVVGTPGRLMDLAQQHHLILGKVSVLVLDEADEMLDLGFLPDMEKILSMVPEDRQTMLFSATMPGPIIRLSRSFLRQPTHIRAESVNASATHENTAQFVYRAHALNKTEMVARILQAEGRGKTMLFTRTKRTAQKLAEELAERGFRVATVHGDLGQVAREKALDAFRDGTVDVLVATDVAARGIDVDDVTHVINYQCPEDDKTYVHRIGRTGRAGNSGVAVTLVDWDDIPRWMLIDKALDLGKGEPEETYHTSEHLYSDLGIDPDVKGEVGPAQELIGVPTRRRSRARDGQGGRGGERGKRNGERREARGRARQRKDAQDGDGEERREVRGRARQRKRTRAGATQGAEMQQAVPPEAHKATAKDSVDKNASASSAKETGAQQGQGSQRRRRRRRRTQHSSAE